MSQLSEALAKNEKKSIEKWMGKGFSQDFSKMIWAYQFNQTARMLGHFGQQDFISFFIGQVEMLRKEDPERANNLDKDLLDYLEKLHSNGKVDGSSSEDLKEIK